MAEKKPSLLAWSQTVAVAAQALEQASSGSELTEASWWTDIFAILKKTQEACETLELVILQSFSQTLVEKLLPVQTGTVEVGPATLQTLGKALRKWAKLRAALSESEPEEETRTILRSLGAADTARQPDTRTAGESTTLVSDLAKYLPLFAEETEEGIATMQTHLLEIESGFNKSGFLPAQSTIVELFRHAHKIKASSAAMGFSDLSEITHTMETLLEHIRSGKLRISPDLVSALLSALDHILGDVAIAKSGNVPTNDHASVKASLMWFLDAAPAVPTPRPEVATAALSPIAETYSDSSTLSEAEYAKITSALGQGKSSYRIALKARANSAVPEMRLLLATSKLKALGTLLSCSTDPDQIENRAGLDFLSLVLISVQTEPVIRAALVVEDLDIVLFETIRAADHSPAQAPKAGKGASGHTIRVAVERLDELMNLSGELSISKNSFLSVSALLRSAATSSAAGHESFGHKLAVSMEEAIAQLSQLVGGIQHIAVEMRMVPISPLFERSRRLVRDLSHELKKEVDLILIGAETSLDKKIIDQLGDPLNHMIRNAVDHGLESPQERILKGKPALGTITLKAEREGGKICISISDDGRGVSVDDIRNKIVELRILGTEAAQALTSADAMAYIFHPGFSTAKTVTNISGRGVGMDIVKKRIEEINGTVQVISTEGKGTQFQIYLPLTVVSQICLLFDIVEVTFALSLNSISEILRVKGSEILEMGFGRFYRQADTLLPVHQIQDFFEDARFTSSDPSKEEALNLIVVKSGNRRIALIANVLLGEEEVLVKPPGELVGDVRGIAGVSILSSGEIALILDAERLVEQSSRSQPALTDAFSEAMEQNG